MGDDTPADRSMALLDKYEMAFVLHEQLFIDDETFAKLRARFIAELNKLEQG